jgi:methyltransferase-like protein 6
MSFEHNLFLSWLLFCESTTYNDNVCINGYETMDNSTLVENKKDEVVDEDSIESFQVWKQDTPQDVSSFSHILQAPEASSYWRGVYTSRAAKYWEDFYKRHANRFFKDRHYLSRDFAKVFQCASISSNGFIHLLEFGCGCGNALIPLLIQIPKLSVVGFDLSSEAIQILNTAVIENNINKRISCFVRDACDKNVLLDSFLAQKEQIPQFAKDLQTDRPLFQKGFDIVLMLFMLSAMAPEKHVPILKEAWASLRPGGYLILRDYSYGDAAQLRFGTGKKLDKDGSLFVRQDGTLAYFFTLERLRAITAQANLEEVEATILFRRYSNRGLGIELRRCFISAVFRRAVW